MKPPQDLVQGKPSYKLNGGKYHPTLTTQQPVFTTKLADNLLMNKKVKNEYIPSPQKSIGIEQSQSNISLACRSVNDLRRVERGNGLFYNKQLVGATPINPLSRQAFSNDRLGISANFKQSHHLITTFD